MEAERLSPSASLPLVPEPALDPPDTLLGKLQRGRGAGYREALVADRRQAAECVLHSLLGDTATTWGAGYYADLLLRLDAPVEPLLDRFAARGLPVDDYEEDRAVFAARLLGELARRGERTVDSFLRQYIRADGVNWMLAAVTSQIALDVDTLEHLLERRDGDGLRDLVCMCEEDPVWRELRGRHPAVARAFAAIETERSQRAVAPPPPDLSAPSRQLLEAIDDFRDRSVERAILAELARRRAPGDIEYFLGVFRTGELDLTAAEILGRQDERRLLPEIGDLAGSRYSACLTYLTHLPVGVVQPWARGWIDRPGRATGLALDVLGRIGDESDGPRIVRVLERSLADPEGQHMFDSLRALERCATPAARRSVERAYVIAGRPPTRARALGALLRIAPHSEHVAESLWDVHASVRTRTVLGCPADDPALRSRWAELAADPFEAAEVRAAARQRLSTTIQN